MWADNVNRKYLKFLTNVEKQLADSGSKFVAGDKVTIADFIMYSTLQCTVLNEQHPGRPTFKKMITQEQFPKLFQYADVIGAEFAAHTATHRVHKF